MVSNAQTDADGDTGVEELLERAADRVTVQRVLEYVRGDADAGDVRKGDWFQAIETVAAETGEDLVVFSAHEHDDGHDVATIWAVDDDFGRIIHVGWSECRFPSKTPGFTGPSYVNRNDVEDRFRFDSGRPREVLRLEDAKQRLREFAAAHGGDA
ncbi:hypothetical protein [Natrinema thermotolerans]|uniref:hypothetical protein n=1 Tax=Natrinema thermotolerans TaxID=121872 RepID=UPI000678ADA9|nr:hypothetical protein [Natrinema thermotolerans]QCC57327.1 hypothetical protein DVR14_01210 [Natrinema thermotolerans]